MSVTLETSHFDRSRLNDLAFVNMKLMSVTLETSHLDVSSLKSIASANMPLISITRDTSHSVIGPSGSFGQSPFADDFRHAVTAPSSSALDENAEVVVVVQTVCDIDPDDPLNMNLLLAFQSAQSAPQSCWLNDDASKNTLSMLVTRDTSHFEMSLLNAVALSNQGLIFKDKPLLKHGK